MARCGQKSTKSSEWLAPQSYFDDILEEYVERRNTLITELKKIKGIKVGVPKGAFYCMVELPINPTAYSYQIIKSTCFLAPILYLVSNLK